MNKIVFLRHGESIWNKENRFTGWVDVDLSPTGEKEAIAAGRILKKEGFHFDQAFTSVLKRAIHTLWRTLDELDQPWLPVEKNWRLNERHYGNLQGLNKIEMVEKFGEKQVFEWRRSYATPPPALTDDSPYLPQKDPKYAHEDQKLLPRTEALKQCLERVLPYWNNAIAPKILSGQRILVVAHGNSIRAIIKHLDQVSDNDISELNIPTAVPLVYELDGKLKPTKHYYLGDAAEIEKKAKAVAAQTKK